MNKVLLTAILALFVTSSQGHAEDPFGGVFGAEKRFDAMSGGHLKRLISNRKIYLHTSMGTNIPISYSSNGTMMGEGGKLAKYLSGRKFVRNDSGKWWISRNRLCQKWNNWMKRKSTCIKARKEGRTVYWKDDNGKEGTAGLGPRLKTSFNANMTGASLLH